jgi:hypothetical protein
LETRSYDYYVAAFENISMTAPAAFWKIRRNYKLFSQEQLTNTFEYLRNPEVRNLKTINGPVWDFGRPSISGSIPSIKMYSWA